MSEISWTESFWNCEGLELFIPFLFSFDFQAQYLLCFLVCWISRILFYFWGILKTLDLRSCAMHVFHIDWRIVANYSFHLRLSQVPNCRIVFDFRGIGLSQFFKLNVLCWGSIDVMKKNIIHHGKKSRMEPMSTYSVSLLVNGPYKNSYDFIVGWIPRILIENLS